MIRTVALVGASHPAARALAVALEADPRVERVLGISGSEPPLLGPKFEYMPSSPEQLAKHLDGADAVVIFPSIDAAARDPEQARVAALESLRHVLAGIDKETEVVVLWSSAVVYGAHADNPVPLHEGDPLRPNGDFPAAGILADMEGIVLGAVTSARRVVLRAAPVWASERGTFTVRWLQGAGPDRGGDADPVMQALHPDDAASALALAVGGDLDGVYNVAPADSVPLSQAARLSGRRLVSLPAAVLRAGAERLAQAGLTGPPGELAYLSQPWVVDAAAGAGGRLGRGPDHSRRPRGGRQRAQGRDRLRPGNRAPSGRVPHGRHGPATAALMTAVRRQVRRGSRLGPTGMGWRRLRRILRSHHPRPARGPR